MGKFKRGDRVQGIGAHRVIGVVVGNYHQTQGAWFWYL